MSLLFLIMDADLLKEEEFDFYNFDFEISNDE